MKLFTIIIPHYDKSISDEQFEKCLLSLYKQKIKDFEVLIYHDGELNKPLSTTTKILIKKLGAKFSIEPHQGVWGHNNRDKGIYEAEGEYIIHLNSDNILYDLEAVKIFIENTKKQDIYIFPIKMIGTLLLYNGIKGNLLKRTRNPKDETILTGFPKRLHIDCMQLIAKTNVWRENGGWYDFREESDGYIYEQMCKRYNYVHTDLLLGEHW